MSAAPMSAPVRGVTVRLDAIEIPSSTRPYNATAVVELSRSIAAIGLQSAPTVVERGRGYLLVVGRHRIEALKLLGYETVFVRLADMDDLQARMWTISENCIGRNCRRCSERNRWPSSRSWRRRSGRRRGRLCNLHTLSCLTGERRARSMNNAALASRRVTLA